MKATLSPIWELSTDHAASRDGQPVLVHRSTGATSGPGDIVRMYPSFGRLLAADTVRRLRRTAQLDAEGEALVARFVGLLPAA